MANTLTGLIPTLYEALDVVSREMVGFTTAVSLNASAERAALNQSILVPLAPAGSTADNTPGVTAPNTGDHVIGNTEMKITKSKHFAIRYNGEEQRGLGASYQGILRGQFAQAFRALVNEMETDVYAEVRKRASRAYGTAGTTPFGTAANLTDIAEVRRILEDNGAPVSDLQLVLGSAATAKLRGIQSNLFKVNEAGTSELLRMGNLGMLEGFELHNSAAVTAVTKGTGASYQVNNAAGIAVGGTTVAADTGTGTILAGDIVTFAADSNNKYVVGTALSGGSFALNAPGARVLIPDDNAITVGNNFTANCAFSRSAVQLVTRPPAMPIGPDGRAMDMADDVMLITDPVSNITFEVAVYRQYMQLVYHVRLAWGQAAIKPEHIAILLG